MVVAYALAGVWLATYIATLVLRDDGQFWTWLDNWSVDALELTMALLCLSRFLVRRPGRSVGLAFGLGLLAWAIGDTIFTLESQGGASPPTPSLADAFYLLMYPLAYLGIMLIMRGEVRSFKASTWLDGAVAGLGAAAICAAFVFDTIINSVSGSPAAVAVNLAYPIGDLILLAFAFGTLVIVPGCPARLITLVAGCLVLAVGDTVYLFQNAAGTYQSGTILDATWMTAVFLLSLTVWQRVGARRADDDTHAPGFVLPAIAATSAVVIIFAGNWTHIGSVALGLTVATLVLVGVRAALSRRELNALTLANHHQAVTDELTGLGNRRLLTRELEAIFTNHHQEWDPDDALALVMIDLDHFKEINDSFGHPTGDGLLRLIGPRLSSVTRSSDVVVRLGGDEFAVLLTGADVEFAMSIAERITTEIEPPFEVGGSSLHVGASIGIALAPQHATDATELMRCADVAMYRAKAAHSSYDIYESALDDGADRLNLMEDLRAAIAEESLTLYYQPQIDLRTGGITTLEALLRWAHPKLGFIPPDQFIPLAEDSGLMGVLTTFVLETAVAQCAEWRRAGHPVSVAVNLSTTNLLDAGLPDQVHEVLARNGLTTDSLVLEITESTVMADLARSKEIIRTLSDSGLLISIDDFGTGFSSLAYLSDLAVGELKIDRMFTARLSIDGQDGRDEAIIRSSIELGHSLGLRVVAEGVERSDHFGFLATAGCDVAQGYAISFPQPPEDLDFEAIDDRAAPMMPKANH
jgi:diguanylate cyclase (GGDEF)-like protein